MATVERFPSQPIGGLTLPFSEAVRVGDLLFLSGNLGHLPGKLELVPGGIAAETRQALETWDAVLADIVAGRKASRSGVVHFRR